MVKPWAIMKYRRLLKYRRVKFRRRPLIQRTSTVHSRYEWCLDHFNDRDTDWKTVIFTDEVNFSVGHQRLHCWKLSHDGPKRCFVAKFPPKVMFWGGIHWNGKTELVRIDGTVDGPKYKNVVHEYLGRTGLLDDYSLLQDGAPAHTARVVQDYFDENPHFTVLQLPAHSPELNPIEKVWGWIKHKLTKRETPPKTKDELEIAVREIWEQMPLSIIRKFISYQYQNVIEIMRVGGESIDEVHFPKPKFRNDVV